MLNCQPFFKSYCSKFGEYVCYLLKCCICLQKNGTSPDNVTVFTGGDDIRQFGLIDKFNGQTHLLHWKTEKCNRLNGSDGSIFPPHITPNTTLYVYDKDLCRLLPLRWVLQQITYMYVKQSTYSLCPERMVCQILHGNWFFHVVVLRVFV